MNPTTTGESPYGYYKGPLPAEMVKAVAECVAKLPTWQLSPTDVLFPQPDRLAAKLRAARREFERSVKLWTEKGREKARRACKIN